MGYSGVGVIVEDQEGNFLLHLRDANTSRMTNQWCLIGGSIEANEDILNAAIREVKEETNLSLVEVTHVHDFVYNGKSIALIKGNVDTANEKMSLGEGADLKFFSKEQLVSLLNSIEYSNPYLEELSTYLEISEL